MNPIYSPELEADLSELELAGRLIAIMCINEEEAHACCGKIRVDAFLKNPRETCVLCRACSLRILLMELADVAVKTSSVVEYRKPLLRLTLMLESAMQLGPEPLYTEVP